LIVSSDAASAGLGGSFGKGWPGSLTELDRKPATIPELLDALARVYREAAALADRAYEAIQHHAFDPYREFCEKRAEHSALASVLCNRIGSAPQDPRWITAIDEAERGLLTLSIQACVKFCFALSASPLLPIGVRETFLSELEMLRASREQLVPIKDEAGVAALLDEIETSLMLLEEIVGRAPALEEF
jgi:hypothetical protein